MPSFDELDAGPARGGLGGELTSVEQFAFEPCEEAFAHGVVLRVADGSHRRARTASLQRRPDATDVSCDPWSL